MSEEKPEQDASKIDEGTDEEAISEAENEAPSEPPIEDEAEPETNTEPESPAPKKRGLGRGLDALFGDEEPETLNEDAEHITSSADGADGDIEDENIPGKRQTLGIDQIIPNPDQPRRQFDEDSIAELADSITRHGLLQPILVRPVSVNDSDQAEPQYEIIAGERRWRACQKAGIHSVSVIIHALGDEETLEIALIENLQREDLNAMDEAFGYKRLLDDFGKTQEELASIIGKSRPHISNMLRLINLPDGIQAMVREGKLSAGHARTLIKAENPEEAAKKIIADGLSVRQAEKLAAGTLDKMEDKESQGGSRLENALSSLTNLAESLENSAVSSSPVMSGKAKKDVNTLALEEEIANMLGMKVDIQLAKKGGKLVIAFDDLDQLDDLLHRLTHGGV